jgi:hypothetical protein
MLLFACYLIIISRHYAIAMAIASLVACLLACYLLLASLASYS